MSKHRWLGLLLIPGILLVSGCGGEAVTFNNSIAKVTKSLETMGKSFGETIAKEKDPGRLQAAHNDLIAKVKALVAEANAIKVPASQEAQAYWSAFQIYLKNQEKMVTEDFKEVVAIMGNPTPDMGRLQGVFGRIGQVENNDLAGLKSAQAAFAKANGMTLK